MKPSRCDAGILPGLTGIAAPLLAFLAPVTLATPRPEPPEVAAFFARLGPGWYKNAIVYKGDFPARYQSPPRPVNHARIHTALAGGTPEWKMILIAAAAALLGAALTQLLNGPRRPAEPPPRDPRLDGCRCGRAGASPAFPASASTAGPPPEQAQVRAHARIPGPASAAWTCPGPHPEPPPFPALPAVRPSRTPTRS